MHAVPEPVAEPPAVRRRSSELPERDVRAKRPPLLSFLLRWSTLRRVARVVSLLALDLAGVFLAIFTALLLKDVVHGRGDDARARSSRRATIVAVRLPGHGAAVRALEHVLRPRRAAGLRAHPRDALPGDGASRCSSRSSAAQPLHLLLPLLRLVLLRAALRRHVPLPLRGRSPALLLRAAGYRRRAVLVGSAEHIDAVARALGAGPARRGRGRRLRAARAATPRDGCARSARSRRSAATIEHEPRRRGDHRRPRLPRARAARARRPRAQSRACACGSRRRRWRCWSTTPSSSPGSRCRCSSCARRSSRALDFVAQAHLRPRSSRRSA